MFPRIHRVTSGDRQYEYLQILEAYRDNGRPKQRVVANLGRLDLMGDKLDDLVGSLRKYCRRRFTLPEEMACEESLPWGPVLLTRYLWEQVNLRRIIGAFCPLRRKKRQVACPCRQQDQPGTSSSTAKNGRSMRKRCASVRWNESVRPWRRWRRRWRPGV